MGNEQFDRTIRLIGEDAFKRIQIANIAIVGIGGVGSYAAEAIARAGCGHITLMDGDNVAMSNLNRQLVALHSSLGQNKAQVMAERIKDINPEAKVVSIPYYYKQENDLDVSKFDYVIDAIDDVDSKIKLIAHCIQGGTQIVSAMGAAGKFETNFKQADITNTTTCPLARIVRKRLREFGIEHLPVVYSEEKPTKTDGVLGTMSYVPGACGLELAGYVIRQIASMEGEK